MIERCSLFSALKSIPHEFAQSDAAFISKESVEHSSGLEKSAAIRPFATKKSRLESETFLLADSLATESCRLADRLATKLFFKADNADAD